MRVHDDEFKVSKEVFSKHTVIYIERYYTIRAYGEGHEQRALDLIPAAKQTIRKSLEEAKIAQEERKKGNVIFAISRFLDAKKLARL
jgi:hypothetical protein